MRESVIRDFLAGRATVAELRCDLQGAVERSGPPGGPHAIYYRSAPLPEDFGVRPEHVLRLLDALEAAELTLEELDPVANTIEMSEHFRWDADTPDGERVSEAIFWLANPEINYPLTPKVLMKIRHYLVTGRNTLTIEDTKSSTGQRDV